MGICAPNHDFWVHTACGSSFLGDPPPLLALHNSEQCENHALQLISNRGGEEVYELQFPRLIYTNITTTPIDYFYWSIGFYFRTYWLIKLLILYLISRVEVIFVVLVVIYFFFLGSSKTPIVYISMLLNIQLPHDNPKAILMHNKTKTDTTTIITKFRMSVAGRDFSSLGAA